MIKDDKLSQVIGTLHRLTSDIFTDAIQRKLILDNLTEGVFTVDLELKITSFNKAAEAITGVSEDEAIGRTCSELFKSGSEDDFCTINQVLESREPVLKQMRLLLVDEHQIPVLVSTSPLIDMNDAPVGAIQSFQEVTEIFHRQLILDSVFDGVFTVDKDFKITLFNKAAEQLTGYKQHEVLGHHFQGVFYPQQIDSPEKSVLRRAVSEGAPATEDCFYLETKSGRTLPVSVSAAPLIDARGDIFGGVETFRDNTDRIQAGLILDHVVEGVFTLDTKGIITSFNKAAVEITGYSQEEALGEHGANLLAFNEPVIVDQSPSSSVPPLELIDTSNYLKVKDGRVIPVSISSLPFTDEENRVLGTVQTFRDITQQIENQHILDSVADGVFTVNRDFIITSFNKSAEHITGYKSDEVLGKKCRDIFTAKICDLGCPIAKALETKERVTASDVLFTGKDGESIPVSVSSTALFDSEGNIIGGVETFRDLTEIKTLKQQLSKESEQTGILSRSPRMQRILSVLPQFAKSDSTILVLGESGTGKELIAKAIHTLSSRKEMPFVAVNSGALPDTLLESELFGYKAGAFTDARQDRKGRFATAEKGTLFLDEIGDISQAMQVKLLRVLQTKMYEPLGSNAPIDSDVRIIAATNKHLEEMVKDNQFREDLYYRLNVVKVELPALRERMEDLPMLVEHFIDHFNTQRNKDVKGISEEALAVLMRHEYPGNIRELENIIEYAFILCHEGLIQPQHLPENFGPESETDGLHGPLTLVEVEKRAIIESLSRNDNKKMKTCRELGISKDTLRRKLKVYGLIQ